MEPKWAAEHLQVIRTLMERSALYRRALAPVTIYTGSVGLLAATAGRYLDIYRPAWFVAYWFAIGAVAMGGSLLLVRRQAFQQAEPFWSPPTRRVAQAMLPPLTAGFVIGTLVLLADALQRGGGVALEPAAPNRLVLTGLPLAWVILYGCAIHAAGFFMARGMRLFGWGLIGGGCAAFFATAALDAEPVNCGYTFMGLFFGVLHLAYGIYLYFTEPRRNET
jgi:hypothetical protein